MSEKILKALLQLFAIIADADDGNADQPEGGRSIVARFLRNQFSEEFAQVHLATFDGFVQAFHSSTSSERSGRKRTSLNSVKVLRICAQINEELNQRQKFVVLVHLLEFIQQGAGVNDQEREFVSTVADSFHISREEFGLCESFVDMERGSLGDAEELLVINGDTGTTAERSKHLHAHGLDGEIGVLHVPSVDLFVMRYTGGGKVLLNGRMIDARQHYVLSNGSSLKPSSGRTIYYSDILGRFLKGRDQRPIVFRAEHITYRFPNGRYGLHDLELAETSGKLIGIMGGSGSGKSTLLNVLNGNLTPTEGRVTINGVDVHRQADLIRGVIGHVSQDDLLIEELTVFQNLFFNAKLCFGDQSDEGITEKVLDMLRSLGLYESKDLRVGNVLEKTISGGQRKRLNIALELIRKPSVLFVDEPTSGLSSRDSENIMDLLKELALQGRIVFVVIHQPSSDIFKLFDRLLLIDQEGYPVYYGDAVESVVYFKRVTGQVNSDEGPCRACGNVNPEQIFNILEAKLVDEYGIETDQRRIGPEAWNEVYRAQMDGRSVELQDERSIPRSTFRAPDKRKQFRVFFLRDILSKLANRQYVLINVLEAPVLALVMTFFLRFQRNGGEGTSYVFRYNENIPQFLFIAVIVSLFLGLTVAAEEIIRDRKIRERERFLSLSTSSYLLSKISILFLISAVQSALFIAVAQYVLDIRGMAFPYWAMLFTTSCFANVLGLNVSQSFNSAKVIYILIPVLIIPQLLFSGVIVKFDKLHPWFASQNSVPWIGNIMASRWAYEGLAVKQFKDNAYERQFYAFDQRMKLANWKKDLWVKDLQHRAADIRSVLGQPRELKDRERDLELLRAELAKEEWTLQGFRSPLPALLSLDQVDGHLLDEVDAALDVLVMHYRRVYKEAEQAKEATIAELTGNDEKRAAYFELLDRHRNDELAEFVTNRNDVNVIVEYEGQLVQKSDPVYLERPDRPFLGAHFYAPSKFLFGLRIPTFWANILVLWSMSFLFALALRHEFFPNLMARTGRMGSALRMRKGSAY
ncbi:MAG: ATP-binding cassette domain-containing protein [Flavobacteriales bacterium]|nr:ATP-binding cassette domain-containing protein [Flavobacteriales bacterium]